MEALFLADELEATIIGAELHRRAAEELRRLHGLDFALRNCELALKKMTTKYMDAVDQRDALLEALKYHQEQTRPIQRSIDAIALCEGHVAAAEGEAK